MKGLQTCLVRIGTLAPVFLNGFLAWRHPTATGTAMEVFNYLVYQVEAIYTLK